MDCTRLLSIKLLSSTTTTNFKTGATLIFGICIGISMALVFSNFMDTDSQFSFKRFLSEKLNAQELHRNSNMSLAEILASEIKVLCWIMTGPQNHKSKARHVLQTWGKRCNKLIFISSKTDKSIGSIALNVSEGRDHLWEKTKEAYKYLYENYINDYDWFVKADDDTYMIIENLRYMLYQYSPNDPLYFGCKFKNYVNQGYMSGGAGYVLSREAVKRFVLDAIPDPEICREGAAGSEDVEIGVCLENVNVIAGDSRDEKKRGRFFPLTIEEHLMYPFDRTNWYWRFIFYKIDTGFNCCSNYAISFHYITPYQMYVLDNLIYRLKLFGIVRLSSDLPRKVTMEELLAWQMEAQVSRTNMTERGGPIVSYIHGEVKFYS